MMLMIMYDDDDDGLTRHWARVYLLENLDWQPRLLLLADRSVCVSGGWRYDDDDDDADEMMMIHIK